MVARRFVARDGELTGKYRTRIGFFGFMYLQVQVRRGDDFIWRRGTEKEWFFCLMVASTEGEAQSLDDTTRAVLDRAERIVAGQSQQEQRTAEIFLRPTEGEA